MNAYTDTLLFTFALLVLSAGIVVPLIISAKWNGALVKKNQAARLHNDMDFIRRLTYIRIGDVVADMVQLGILIFVIFGKPRLHDWILVGSLFIISVLARLRINHAKRQLLSEKSFL